MSQTRKTFFTTKSLIILILPIMAECTLSQFIGMADSIMVSSVGEVAISAVSLVNNISAVLLTLLGALACGGTIVTSQLIGAEKHDVAKRSTGQVITLSFSVSVILSLIFLLFNRPILRLLFGKVEQAVLDDGAIYFFYNALSYPMYALAAAGGAILRAKGDSKTMFYISLLSNFVNIAGNTICIYGLKMGVAGVAIPTLLSRTTEAVVVMLIVMFKNHPLRPELKDIFHVHPALMRRMLRVGLPTAVENSIFQLGKLLTVGMISGFGTAQLAANSTASSLVTIISTFNAAIRTASMNVISQCVGARDERQIKLNFKRLLIMSYIVTCTTAIATVLLRRPLISLYTGLSPESAEITSQLMCIFLIAGIFLYPLTFYVNYPLRAANDGAYCMWVSMISMLVFRLSLAQILCVNLGMGARGVWYAMVVDWICRSICFTWRWCSGRWKKKCDIPQNTLLNT